MFDNPFSMVVAIVLIVSVANVLRAKYRRDHRLGGGADGGADAEARGGVRRLHDEIAALKERVAVLERIVTDRSSSLEREIEALRSRD